MAHLIPKLVYGTPETVIEFTYPPREDDGEQYDAQDRVSVALDGTRWTQLQYIEVKRKVKLAFLTDAQVNALRTFYVNHAAKTLSFKWYEDKDLTSYQTYELQKNAMSFNKITSVAGGFIWEVTIDLRRVIL